MRARATFLCAFLLISAIAATAATYQTIHSFTSFQDDENPFAGVIFDHSGNLYGVAAWGETNEGMVFQLIPSPSGGWNFNVLHEFSEQDPQGAGLIGGLVMDEAGNLYGTASYDHGDWQCGTVFTISNSEFSVLHVFSGVDGCDPEAALTYSNGLLWGTTKKGGTKGQGTVFSLTTSGDEFKVYSFSGKTGTEPLGAFSAWSYGSTFTGGGQGQGEIYKVDPVKGLIRKHSFNLVGKAGYNPIGDLLTIYVGGVRTMYGVTSAGGVAGGGTVYQLTETLPNSNQWRVSVLHSFASDGPEGWAPLAGVTVDAAGNLYGTTSRGGENGSDCGTVFKLAPSKNDKWTHTVLYSFDSSNSDGCDPTAGLVFDKAGNLYGTTQWGGDWSYGTVFKIIP
jgi:uncharacterized repeat protein (TIGR03803 family)